jgi:hypothetical protein
MPPAHLPEASGPSSAVAVTHSSRATSRESGTEQRTQGFSSGRQALRLQHSECISTSMPEASPRHSDPTGTRAAEPAPDRPATLQRPPMTKGSWR